LKSSFAIIISALFFILVTLFIYGFNYNGTTFVEPIKELGNLFINYNSYGYIFEILAVLLLSSMFGAFYLASKEEDR